ncbi:MAG: hypothetical protein NTW86_24830, partial [Candidatus Sumerlaeota bacterium]|nr:hypothetical protein [Candidatus Sumerlaeota bacterium]
MRTVIAIVGLLLLPIAPHAASKGTGGDAVVYPDSLGAEITDWGYDIKQPGKAALLTPQLARDLFVTDQLTCLRVAIYGDKLAPAHPGPGVVVEKYYVDQLAAMTNAREARKDVLFYADKKLESQETFP